jgi:hypothetical protein
LLHHAVQAFLSLLGPKWLLSPVVEQRPEHSDLVGVAGELLDSMAFLSCVKGPLCTFAGLFCISDPS